MKTESSQELIADGGSGSVGRKSTPEMTDHQLQSAPSPTPSHQVQNTPSPSETMEMIMKLAPTRHAEEGGTKIPVDSIDHSASGEKYQRVNRLRILAKVVLVVSIAILFTLSAIQLAQLWTFMTNALKTVTQEELHLMGFRFRDEMISSTASLQALSAQPSIKQLLQGNVSMAGEVETMLFQESRIARVSIVMLLDANKRIVLSSGGTQYGEEYDPLGTVSEVFSAGFNTNPLYMSAAIQATEFNLLNGTEFVDKPWSLKARQSMTETGQQIGLAQYVVLPLFSEQEEIVGALLAINLLNGNMDMIEGLMEVFQGGYAGVFVQENGTVYEVAHALHDDHGELNLNWKIPSDEINAIASSLLADSTPDLVPNTRTYQTSEYGTLILSALRTEGWERDHEVSSSHRGQTFLVRGKFANALDSNYSSLQVSILALATAFTVFHVLAMFSAVHHVIDPLDKLLHFVKKGRKDKYGDILPRIMSRKLFAIRVGTFIVIASGFLIAIVPLTTNSINNIADQLTETQKEFRGLLHSYSQKMSTLVISSVFLSSTNLR
jgi:hypothetical protein